MKTREELIASYNQKIRNAIVEFQSRVQNADYADLHRIVNEELRTAATTSDQWLDFYDGCLPSSKMPAYKIAQLVLTRNAYHDGLPFCPLCGRIGLPTHNGEPVTKGYVCELCNERKVIPARIRQAIKEK